MTYGQPVKPEYATRSLKLTDRKPDREAESTWADMVALTSAKPGAWLDALAYLAAPNYNRTAIEVVIAWGLA